MRSFTRLIFCLLISASAFPTAPLTAPTPLNTTGWNTVMMISAHPDDNESGAGGLTAMLTQAGVMVVYMIVTNGNKGCHPGNAVVDCGPITPPEIAALRKKEAKAAADALGVSELIMLDMYAYSTVLCRRHALLISAGAGAPGDHGARPPRQARRRHDVEDVRLAIRRK